MSEVQAITGSQPGRRTGKRRPIDVALPDRLLLKTILTQMTLAMAVFDHEMRYIAASNRWLQDFNLADDIIGQRHYDVFDVPESRKAQHQRALNGEVLSGEFELVEGVTDHNKWIWWELSPWYVSDGSIGGITITAEYVTDKVRLEHELHYRETIYRTLARNYPNSGVLVFDRDLRYVLAEGESLQRQGLPSDYFEGRTLYEVSQPKTIEQLEPYYKAAIAGQRSHVEFLRRTGRYFDLHFIPLRDASDDVVAGMLVSRDITEQYEARKRLEDSEKRFRTIVNDQTDLICLVDKDGQIEFANSAFHQYFDLADSQITDVDFFVLSSQDPISERANLQAIMPAAPFVNSSRPVPSKSGTEPTKWVQWTTRGIFDADGNLERYQAVGHDITLRKRLEKVEKKRKALERTLKEISGALNSTLELDKVLEQIINNIERIVPYDAANVMLIEDNIARVVRTRGYAQYEALDEVLALELPIENVPHLRRMVRTGRSLVLADLTHRRDRWLKHESLSWVKSYAGTPIWLQGEIIGFLSIESTKPGFYKKKHARRLRTFADNTATAIRNAQLYEQAQQAGMWEERQRIARELHDAVSQALFAANMVADALPLMWDKNQDAIPDQLQTLRQYTHLAFTEMRTMLFELRPQALEHARLTELVQQLVHSFQSRTRILIDLQIDDDGDPTLPTPVKIAFYRISQEAINNIIHHSGATSSSISLVVRKDHLNLTVIDNGRGFSVDEERPGHIGLQIMHDRAAEIGAVLTIVSRPGAGTRIETHWNA